MDTWLSRAIEQEAPTSKSMIKWWEHVTLDMERIGIVPKRNPAKVIDFSQYIENNRGTTD